MKKILYSILGNSGGHVSAARAVIAAMEELKFGPFEHESIDFTLRIKTFWTDIAYAFPKIDDYLPWSWKMFYYLTNEPKKINILYNIFYPLLYEKKILKIFEEEKPDLVVSLVGPPTQGMVRVIRALGRKIPIITVVLDPVSVHASWVDPGVDCMVVATEEARATCIKFGMPEEKIKVIGFPVHPRFLQDYGTKEELRKRFDLDPYTFTVLAMGGGAGLGQVFNIAKILDRSNLNIQLIVVAGFNKSLETKLLQARFRFPVKVFGFTDMLPQIMSASDVIITKAGAGAVFEPIVKELPLIITGNIPGQEEGNVDYVEKHGIGIIARKPDKIVEAVRQMQTEGTEKYKTNIRRIKNPSAVYDIAKLIASYL